MVVSELQLLESGINTLDPETENSTTETQKRDTTDAWKGKRRAVVRRGTDMVNCLWLPVNGHKAQVLSERVTFHPKAAQSFLLASLQSAFPNLSICIPLKTSWN